MAKILESLDSGIILLDKPENVTSAKIINEVKKKIKVKKIGHGGTLDPFASGLLICMINKATRLSKFFLKSDKSYLAKMHLGVSTDTFDRDGKVTKKSKISHIDKGKIEKVLLSFKGKSKQVPPSFSALKHNGVPLYKLARKDIFLKKEAREIEIKEIKLIDYNFPFVEFKVLSSSGTYIRSLAYDIGEKLKTGAHLTSLRRVTSGKFDVKDAQSLSDLNEENKSLIPMGKVLDINSITIESDVVEKIKFGQKLSESIFLCMLKNDTFYKLLNNKNELVAIIKKEDDVISYDSVFI